MEKEKIIKAGKIAKEVVDYARGLIKPGMKLLEIAEKIDAKILELGGKPAFPVNLSVNEIAAHSTPAWNDTDVAKGLLKVDVGVHVDGWCADTAFSIDLDNDDKNKKLIQAAESGLKKALELFDLGVRLNEIGGVIEREIRRAGFSPVVNLSGHQIDQYDLHAGLTIPNIDNSTSTKLEEGLYAVEPFATDGFGKVRDGKPSGIFQIKGDGNVRDNFARDVLAFIREEYNTLPFCSRWIYNKFGSRGLLALRMIKQIGLLHEYEQLVEVSGRNVAQAEHTILLKNGKVVTTAENI